jgi:hypothetical protein
MDALRTTSGWIGDVDHLWELFSSMGNGYTFELETLIFYTLSVSTCTILGIPPDVTVYGDDIILPSEAVELLTEVFAACGFRLNMAKSHYNRVGPFFRESCGGHFLDGKDVTPFYVTEELNTPESIVLLANNLMRWSTVFGPSSWDSYRDGRMKPVYDWVISHLTEAVRSTYIPFGEANDGLIKDFDEASPSIRYSCRSPQGEIVQATDSSFNPCGVHLQRMRLGYVTKSFEKRSRGRRPKGRSALLIWLYSKDALRFSPQKPSVFNPARHPLWMANWQEPNDYVPYKVPSLKESREFSQRVVTSWPYMGPWL